MPLLDVYDGAQPGVASDDPRLVALAGTGGLTTMASIADRLARCIPGATFELEALARLVGIEETTAVPTAAVTCRGRARMLVNPDFVAEHCIA